MKYEERIKFVTIANFIQGLKYAEIKSDTLANFLKNNLTYIEIEYNPIIELLEKLKCAEFIYDYSGIYEDIDTLVVDVLLADGHYNFQNG
jgi:hypothetical protein